MSNVDFCRQVQGVRGRRLEGSVGFGGVAGARFGVLNASRKRSRFQPFDTRNERSNANAGLKKAHDREKS